MVDGLQNSVVESDIVPLDAPAGSLQNFAGNAFFVKDEVIKTETGRPYDLQKERRWRIVNPAKKHYSSGKDVGYVVGIKGGATPLMARSDGWAVKRATFVTNSMWVVKDVEEEKGGRMWPAGKYVPQTREEPEDSVGKWVQGKKNVENEDIVVFFTIGGWSSFCDCSQDVDTIQGRRIYQGLRIGLCTFFIFFFRSPAVPDWVRLYRMPVEHLNVTFKPNSFFRTNPSMDVPGTFDLHSRPAFPNGVADGSANGNGSACHH